MKIGELARATATPVESIRFYERQALLPAPARTAGNYRIYDVTHQARLEFIRHCRSLDMTLDEIRTLLALKDTPLENCAGVNALLDEHIGHVTARIAELERLRIELEALRARCVTDDGTGCRILEGLVQSAANEAKTARRRKRLHVPGAHGRRAAVPGDSSAASGTA